MNVIRIITVLISAFILSGSIYARADETDRIIGEFEEVIPNEVKENIDVRDTDAIPSFADLIDICIKSIRDNICAPAKALCAMLFIITVNGIFHAFSETVTNERLLRVLELACSLSMTLSMLSVCSVGIDAVGRFLDRISDFSAAIAPILTGLCIMSGNPGSAAITSTGISIFVSICHAVFSAFLLSLVRMSFAISVCSALGDNIPDLSGVSVLFKRTFSIVMGFAVMLFCAVGTYQSIIFSGADSLSYRTVRFAVGNAVPVVGASLGEALRVVSGAISTLRGTIGGIGVCVILLLLIPSAVLLLLNIGAVSISSSISRMFKLDRTSRFLEDVRTMYGQLLALNVCASLMVIFLLCIVTAVPIHIGA